MAQDLLRVGSSLASKKGNPMIQTTSPPLLPAPAAAEPPRFPTAEWEALRQEDRSAAKAVVGIMTLVFTIGLILYATIALIVAAD